MIDTTSSKNIKHKEFEKKNHDSLILRIILWIQIHYLFTY